MWGALFYKVYSGFADNLFEMFELAMLSVQFNRFCRNIKRAGGDIKVLKHITVKLYLLWVLYQNVYLLQFFAELHFILAIISEYGILGTTY